MFKLATTKEPWIRILGLVMVGLGYYYLFTSTNGVTIFYWPTVYARFGIIDAGGAVWTLLTLI